MRGPALGRSEKQPSSLCLCENEKHRAQPQPGWNAELIENPKHVILDGMLGKSQAPCDLPIGQAFRHTANYMLFPLGKDRFTRRFDRSHRFRFTQSLDRISELRTICLDLALMNAMNALGETFRGFRTRENSMGATAEC
jgi:hypothetical protein